MASDNIERVVVQDRNAQTGANAPRQRLAIGGVQSASGAPAQDTSGLTQALDAFGRVGASIKRKKTNADFIEGQMASMAGKTQEEVAAEGNGTSMAGFVSLEVGNAVSEWQTAQLQSASTEHYGTDPATYRKGLSDSAADLISKMGGDDFAEEQLTKSLAPAMQQLSAAQAAQHAQYTLTETTNAYTSSLMLSGQYASTQYEGSASAPSGPAGPGPNGDYKAFAAGVVDQLIGVESSGNPNAQNTESSAGGLGQFIDSTWIATVRKHRPDMAGKSNAELLSMKKGPATAALQREMTIAFNADNAKGLAASGLPVTAGNTYLAHFSGLGGARRVLKGNPTAPVSSTLTAGQISANKSIMYRNGRMITNAELVQWADKKMGKANSASPQVQKAIMTNPGLPPEVHRNAVVGAVITSLAAGDGSLLQNAGGLKGLAGLNLSPTQLGQVQRAEHAFQVERQNDYNMDYERQTHDILEQAGSGDFTEDEMFNKLSTLQDTYSRSDAEMRRVHSLMQKTIGGQEMGVWAEPERQLELMELRNEVLDGNKTAEEAAVEVAAIGIMYGAAEEATNKQVAVITRAYDAVRAKERQAVSSTTKAAANAKALKQNAAGLLSNNILGTGTPSEQTAGIALIEQTLMEDLQAAGVPQDEMAGRASDMMSKVLVNNDVLDTKRASAVRAAMHNPMGEDGKATAKAVEAMAFFLDLKQGANASPEYLARMFKGNEKTLALLYAAEDHMVGDADIDMAVQTAWKQSTDPITAARIVDQHKRIANGDYQTSIKEDILEKSGLADTFWNRALNVLDPTFDARTLDEEQTSRIMNDSGLAAIIDEETRSAISLNQWAAPETITKIVSGQMAERGAIMGGSMVMSPKGTTVPKMMGLNSKETDAPNRAMDSFVRNNGEELFGKAVWREIGPAYRSGVFGSKGQGGELGAAQAKPKYTVQMVGTNFVVTPTADAYANMDSIPEGQSAVVRAEDIGKFYNAKQLENADSARNAIVDFYNGVNTYMDQFKPELPDMFTNN